MGQRLCTNATSVVVDTDPFFANVATGLHFDGANGSTTFTDQKGKTYTANGNAQVSTAQGKFNQSLLLDGSGDYLTTPDNADFDFGTGDFTIDCFIRPTTLGINQAIVAKYAPDSERYFWQLQTDNTLAFYRQDYLGNTLFSVVSTGTIASNTWSYIALVRSGNNFTQYINAVTDGTASTATNVYGDGLFYIGALDVVNPAFNYYFNGYIDDMRITKGVARTISGVPTSAFPDS